MRTLPRVSFLIAYALMVVIAIVVVVGARGELPRSVLRLLAGAAGLGPVAALFHNVVSAVTEAEEPVFFILAVIVSPLAFAIGAFVGANTLLRNGIRTDLASALVVAGVAMLLLPLSFRSPEWVVIALGLAAALALLDFVQARSRLAPL